MRTGAPLVVPCAAEDERVADLEAVTSGQVQAYLGVPLVAASGHVVGVLAAYDAEPRPWSEDEAALVEQLGASVVAELELSAAQSADRHVGRPAGDRARGELDRHLGARPAHGLGVLGRTLRGDLRRRRGRRDDQSVEQLMIDHVHPDDRQLASDAFRVALETGGQYTAETRAVQPDGTVRWVVTRGRVVRDASGEPVRVLGTVLDVTDARQQSDSRLAALQRATASRRWLPSWPTPRASRTWPRWCCAGRRCWAPQSSVLAVFARRPARSGCT